jgi:autotransporter passenger strand-loop-strand repeat protein
MPTLSATTISVGGELVVHSGGIALNTTINEGGVQFVSGGGIVPPEDTITMPPVLTEMSPETRPPSRMSSQKYLKFQHQPMCVN